MIITIMLFLILSYCKESLAPFNSMRNANYQVSIVTCMAARLPKAGLVGRSSGMTYQATPLSGLWSGLSDKYSDLTRPAFRSPARKLICQKFPTFDDALKWKSSLVCTMCILVHAGSCLFLCMNTFMQLTIHV